MRLSATAYRRLAAVVLAAAVLPVSGLAAGEVVKGDLVGKSEAAIAQRLEQQGYNVRTVQRLEEGYFEAYAVLKGKRYEIYVDPRAGRVIAIEEPGRVIAIGEANRVIAIEDAE